MVGRRRAHLGRWFISLMLMFGMAVVWFGAEVAVSPTASAAVIGDDYPANLRSAAKDALVDPWNFFNRECTSFVAWRLNHTNGVGFHNYYLGPHWGNAENWGAAARAAGLTVNSTPAVGAVAWWSSNHVAWVAEVNGSSITIEEYNYNYNGNYNRRTIAASSVSGFIHIKDLPQGNPFGSLDDVSSDSVGQVTVRGWAADPDAKAGPLAVHVYVAGKIAGQTTADQSRPDVAAAYPGYGSNLGYNATLPAGTSGPVQVCTYAINVGAGDTNTQLGCTTVTVGNPNPFGFLDSVTATAPGTVKVGGWAADPNDKDGPLKVHIYANGTYAGAMPANKARPDVAKAYPGYGSKLGYNGTLTLRASGQVSVCAYGINVGTGWENTGLGCKTVTVADPNPFGAFDRAKAIGSRKVTVTGWAADPNDKNGPVKVRVYAKGKYVASSTANKKRTDVAKAHRGYGSHLGYSFTVKVPAKGTQSICVVAVNKGAGWVSPQLGCKTITVK